MTTVGFGRVKHAGDEFRDDAERVAGLLRRVSRRSATPGRAGEKDTVVRHALLLQLALKALDRVIADYCGGARGRRPSYAALAQYLEERERDAQPLPARARRLPA
jgi:hypothetical protein